jgi:hypothetical protein
MKKVIAVIFVLSSLVPTKQIRDPLRRPGVALAGLFTSHRRWGRGVSGKDRRLGLNRFTAVPLVSVHCRPHVHYVVNLVEGAQSA